MLVSTVVILLIVVYMINNIIAINRHTEDMDLHSVNFLHYGAPKSWYCVPPPYRQRFETLLKSLLPDMYRHCPEFVRHKVCGGVVIELGGGWCRRWVLQCMHTVRGHVGRGLAGSNNVQQCGSTAWFGLMMMMMMMTLQQILHT